jgi:hypothetical protein
MLVILCHSPPNLMLWILKTFDYNCFDMRSILKMALERKMWDLVEWILENIDAKMFDIKNEYSITVLISKYLQSNFSIKYLIPLTL